MKHVSQTITYAFSHVGKPDAIFVLVRVIVRLCTDLVSRYIEASIYPDPNKYYASCCFKDQETAAAHTNTSAKKMIRSSNTTRQIGDESAILVTPHSLRPCMGDECELRPYFHA